MHWNQAWLIIYGRNPVEWSKKFNSWRLFFFFTIRQLFEICFGWIKTLIIIYRNKKIKKVICFIHTKRCGCLFGEISLSVIKFCWYRYDNLFGRYRKILVGSINQSLNKNAANFFWFYIHQWIIYRQMKSCISFLIKRHLKGEKRWSNQSPIIKQEN